MSKRGKHASGTSSGVGEESHEKKISKVCEITGCNKRKAKMILEKMNWNVDLATNSFLDLGTSTYEDIDEGTSKGSRRTKRSRNSRDCDDASTIAKQKNDLERFFKDYADKDSSEEAITLNGIARLCEDIGLDSEDPVLLQIAFHCQAKTMFVFTKEEFVRGMSKLNCYSMNALKMAIEGLHMSLDNDSDLFRQTYLFAFNYARADQKSLDLETALGFWRILFPKRFALLPEWLEYVSKFHKHAIMKDEWNQVLEFVKRIPNGKNPKEILKMPAEDSALPLLIDEFTVWYLGGKR
jgi:hypothetical protein